MIEGPVDAREGNFEHSFPGLAIHVEPPIPGLQLMATHQLTDYDVGICQRVSAVGQAHSRIVSNRGRSVRLRCGLGFSWPASFSTF